MADEEKVNSTEKPEEDDGIRHYTDAELEKMKSPYDVGPRPGENGKELRQWKKRVKKARKILRRDLRDRGITKRQEFEQIAWEMGLTLDEKRRGLIWWWWRFCRWVAHIGWKLLLLGGLAALLTTFLASYITESAGSFTINLTGNMLRRGFTLSETFDFKRTSSRLFSEKTKDISNITVGDIPENVNDIDGPHNGANYVAYTFYIRNEGDVEGDYSYWLELMGCSAGVDEAVWLMLFEDGHQVMYTRLSDDGDPEGLWGYEGDPPFKSCAYDEDQYFTKDGRNGILTTDYVDDKIVCQGVVEHVEPQEKHKYTVVIWLEGNDPNCTNDIFGGHAKFQMTFEILPDEHDNLFSGIYRKEYDTYVEEKAKELAGEPTASETEEDPSNSSYTGGDITAD